MKKKILAVSLLAVGIVALAGSATRAEALPCFTCSAPDGFCQRHSHQVLGGGASCQDGGGYSTCTLFGNCNQTLAVTSATLRADGLMTPANGLPQLVAGWTLSTVAVASEAMAITSPSEQEPQLFSALFSSEPNTGITEVVTAGERCPGYAVTVSYTKQEAAALRQQSVSLSI